MSRQISVALWSIPPVGIRLKVFVSVRPVRVAYSWRGGARSPGMFWANCSLIFVAGWITRGDGHGGAGSLLLAARSRASRWGSADGSALPVRSHR
jgi:hypothetical protein